jgi:hypothetical protein
VMKTPSLKTWLLIAGAFAVLLTTSTLVHQARAVPLANDCDNWGNDTADRIATARQLLYPTERQGQTTGSLQGDAQALYQLAQEQANSDPPDSGRNLNGDLIEAFSAGSTALSGGGGASPDAQVAFAKSIVYNADLRVAYLLDGC